MKKQYLVAGSLGFTLLNGCTVGSNSGDMESTGSQGQAAVPPGQINAGQQFFNSAFPHTNGRHCGTCHVANEHLALSKANVEARFAADPGELLFSAVDADDPTAPTLTFNNLRQGLVRVNIKLPDNVDLIQVPPASLMFAPDGAVEQWWADNVALGKRIGDPTIPAGKLPEIITPADRTIELWRAVPSVENTAFSGPFLYDGRASTLAEQALGALTQHSQFTGNAGSGKLENIAQYERSLFTSDRAKLVSDQLEAGIALDSIPKPEAGDPNFAVGQDVYERFCTACHGKATDNRVEQEAVRAGIIFEVDHDGNVAYQSIPGVPVPVPKNAVRPGNEFLNIGIPFVTVLGQVTKGQPPNPAIPAGNQAADFPRYRLRFYRDATRTQQVTDLPPLVRHGANPFVAPARPDGSLIVGPNFGPEPWTSDPGRALITGDYADFEAFNIPQLRGIANTAPYFHDNTAPDLTAVVDLYSQFILPFIPQLNPDGVQPGQHVINATDRAALVQFLSHF